MSAIKVTRTPGGETDKGDFEFRVTVPKESVAAFFAAFPGFELDLIVPQAISCKPSIDLPEPEQCVIPTQSLSMQGWDSAQVGMTIAPNADVLNLCRLPTFQEYALTQLNKNASEIEDIDRFAFEYALGVTGKDICSITAEDYLQKLFSPFSEWMRGVVNGTV